MAVSSQFDAVEFESLYLPYSRIEAELSPLPRLVRGSNVLTTLGGKIAKRYGTVEIAHTNSSMRPDRVWLYETMEASPKVYLLASFYTGSAWAMFYNRLSSSGGWTSMGTLRGLNASTRPHELEISRGLAYIKSFPSGGVDKLGTVIFDGKDASIKYWGLLGPTQPARMPGVRTRLAQACDKAQTTIVVEASEGFPGGAGWVAMLEGEPITVSSINGTTWTVIRGSGVDGFEATSHGTGASVIRCNWFQNGIQISPPTDLTKVLIGWEYTYAFKTMTGQISCRAPLETNPILMPSSTGPWAFYVLPVVTLHGHSDTTNVPTIVVYRSKDGGGTWYKLSEVVNPGDADFSFTDASQLGTVYRNGFQVSIWGGTPDSLLDESNIAPSLTSNSPPPSVVAPLVVGVDPVAPSTKIARFAKRLWYAVDNVLFYSANEEIVEGIPEECWPSGLKGNFFRFDSPVVSLEATNGALLITTEKATHRLTGSNRETFNPKPVYQGVGGAKGHNRASVAFNQNIAFLTHDLRVALVDEDGAMNFVTDPLSTDLADIEAAGAEFDIKYFANAEKEYLVVAAHSKSDPTNSRQWVLDLKLTKKAGGLFWFPPWNVRSVGMITARISESSLRRYLIFAVWNGSTCRFVYFDATGATATDLLPNGSTSGISYSFATHLMQVPAGNHVNERRRPAVTPNVYGVVAERSQFNGDHDPDFYYYLDDLWTTPQAFDSLEVPPRYEQTLGYTTWLLPINKAGKRVAFEVADTSSTVRFELQNFAVLWTPESGA